MTNFYIMFDEQNKFAGFSIGSSKTNKARAVSEADHQKYITALDSGLKDVILSGDNIVIVDKYTTEELQEQESKLRKERAVNQAKILLKENDYRWSNPIKWAEYSEAKRTAVIAYYKGLVAVINGETDNIPELESVI